MNIRKFLKVIGIIIVVISVLIGLIFLYLSNKPVIGNKYYIKIVAKGRLEENYSKKGPYEVSYQKTKVLQGFKNCQVWYPGNIVNSTKKYPLIIVANGTGVPASKYKAYFERLASWGYIVVGNDDDYSWNGFSTDMSLNFIFKANDDPNNVFFNRVDKEAIGVIGHSQGGVGVVNALTEMKHKNSYKTGVLLSPASVELADSLDWHYDISTVAIPLLMLAGTGKIDADVVIPKNKLEELFKSSASSPLIVMGRREETDHGEMLYSSDGYVTAWFQWQLKNDMEAGNVFENTSSEFFTNLGWVDQKRSH